MKKKMITPYKRLSPENQKIWEAMKYLYKQNPDKYFFRKEYCYSIIHDDYVHKILLYEMEGVGFHLYDSITMGSKEIFYGYKRGI